LPQWLDKNKEFAANSLQDLFFGYKIFDKNPGEIKTDSEKDLDFLDLVAMKDTPGE